jgi:DNA transposition AAA+ family ATPase
LTDAAYDNEDFGDVDDLGTMINTETEQSSWRATGDDGDANNFAKSRPGFASLHARPSMKKIEEAIQHETLLNVAVQKVVSDDQDQQHILEEKKSAILVSCNDDTSSNNHHGERLLRSE